MKSETKLEKEKRILNGYKSLISLFNYLLYGEVIIMVLSFIGGYFGVTIRSFGAALITIIIGIWFVCSRDSYAEECNKL